MKTVGEILQLSSSFLTERNIERPRRVAEELLAHVLQLQRMDLYLQFEKPLEETEFSLLRELLKRVGKGEPIQYVIGQLDLLDCKIRIDRRVLIPRPETEILGAIAIQKIKQESQLQHSLSSTNSMIVSPVRARRKLTYPTGHRQLAPGLNPGGKSADLGRNGVLELAQEVAAEPQARKILWDVCAGSGFLGIGLKKACPELSVVLSDLSEEALALAAENSLANGIEVEIVAGDLLTPFLGKRADYVVCNPPYISKNEYFHLDPSVRDYEPAAALMAGERGTEFYERLSRDLPPLLNPKGKVFLEIGSGQGDIVKGIFAAGPWKAMEVQKDWSGQDRFFFLEKQ